MTTIVLMQPKTAAGIDTDYQTMGIAGGLMERCAR